LYTSHLISMKKNQFNIAFYASFRSESCVRGLGPCCVGRDRRSDFLRWLSRSRHSIVLLRSRFAAVICSSFSVEMASGTGPPAAWVSRDSFLRSFSASSVKRAGDFSISRRLRPCPNQKQESHWFASPCSLVRGAQARKDFSTARAPNRFLVFPLACPALVSRVLCFPGQQFLLPIKVCTSLQICAQTAGWDFSCVSKPLFLPP
jgi:hypothetical protein